MWCGHQMVEGVRSKVFGSCDGSCGAGMGVGGVRRERER